MNNVLLTLGLAVLFTVQVSHADDNITISAKQIQALGITTTPLPNIRSGEVSGLPAQVVIPSNQLYIISTPLPSIVERTLVGVGDSVKKGQVISQLNSPALAEAQRGLLQTSVQNTISKENLARDAALYKEGIISESRYRTSKGLALEAQAALAERKSLLRLSGMSANAIEQLQLTNNLSSLLTLTSPIDGIVLEKFSGAGQRLDAAVPLFKIAKIDPLALEIQAPLTMTRDLKPGATITIPAYSASGKLIAVGRSLTSTNQTILLRGIITHGSENLRPGQFIEVTINTSKNSDLQWEIPNSAISRVNSKSVIFVKTPQGFRAQSIHILTVGAQNSVISGAIKDNENIAVHGVSALKASMMGIGGGDK